VTTLTTSASSYRQPGRPRPWPKAGSLSTIDAVYKWEATEEDALNVAILRDGLVNLVDSVTNAQLVEFTDYFVHYEAGNDFRGLDHDMDSINRLRHRGSPAVTDNRRAGATLPFKRQ